MNYYHRKYKDLSILTKTANLRKETLSLLHEAAKINSKFINSRLKYFLDF